MSTQFNPQQQEAIEALGQNVIVSASAGAGKTTVLIARLMKRILKDGVRIDEICAMTFTEAAASEMKIRLLEALNKEAAQNPSDFLLEQISLVETAHISTIHSFCLNIIKNYGYIIGFNPSRADNILSPAEAQLLQEEAMKTIINKHISEDQSGMENLLNIFSSNPLNFASLEEALFQIARWAQEKKNPLQSMNEALSVYSSQSMEDLPLEAQRLFFKMHRDAFQSIIEFIQIMSDRINIDQNPKKMETADTMAQHIHYLMELIDKIDARDFSFHKTILDVLDFKTPPLTDDEVYTQAREDLVVLIRTLIEDYRPLDQEIQLLNDLYPNVKMLFEITQDYMSHLQDLKEEANVLDFSDFEIMALEILSINDHAISKILETQYKEIMVDEFQDTNEHQDEIIRLVSSGRNIFRVGDIKQSIYRFRGAKPQIMQSLIRSNESLNLSLSFNYRSKEHIVAYNNHVFDHLMNLTDGSSYEEHDHVNVGINTQKENSNPVEIHIIETESDLEEDSEQIEASLEAGIAIDYERVIKSDQLSANHISQEILRHHKEGYAFKDMVVLVRSHSHKLLLKDAFEKDGIPHFLNELSGFYNSKVVESVVSLLNYANNGNEFYLAQILHSPFFNFSLDHLAKIRLSDSSFKQGFETLFPQDFAALHTLIAPFKTQDIVTTLQDIIAYNDVYSLKLSIQDKTNLDMLLEKAVLYQGNNTNTLSGFITFVNAFKTEKSSEASPLAHDSDVVTSMTIHQSKGLQFPLVFLFGLGSHAIPDHKKMIISDELLGIAMTNISLQFRDTYKNIYRKIMIYKQDNDEIEEVLRLLYVALTRAQNKMIIVDAVKEFKRRDINARLLRTHRRKIDFLVPASPKSTLIKVISKDDITDKVEDFGFESHSDIAFKEVFTFESEPTTVRTIQNKELNLDDSSSSAMAYGTLIHQAIERLPNHLWSYEDLKSVDPALRKRLVQFNTHPKTLEFYKFNEFYHELSYIVSQNETIFNGIMDYVLVNDTTVALIDFKTDNCDETELRNRYTEQLEGYKKALEIMYPELNLQSFIYSFHLDDFLSF